MTPAPRVVCFDLGGVVIRICGSFREGCQIAGIEMHTDLDATIDHAALAAIVNEHQSGGTDAGRFHAAVSALTAGQYTPQDFERIHDAWILGEYAGMAALIEGLHTAGVESACLSNTNASHWRSMQGIPAFDVIRHRHASHLIGLCKPDPRIYQAFEAATGFSADSILYFDDLVENVLAAATAGWRAELIDPQRETAPQIGKALARHGVVLA